MTTSCGAPRPGWGFAPRSSVRDAHLRVSDAERAETADRLAKHYGDGRLDQAEFNERMEQAMRAKTRADLAGLFDDLPPDGPAGKGAPRRRSHRGLLFLAVLLVVAALSMPSFWWLPDPHVPWLLVALLVFLWARGRHGRARR